MLYITQYGDTLTGIAARLTVAPEYGLAIARQNGLSSDLYTTPVDIALEPGLALEIPDQWLKSGSGAGGFFNSLTPTQRYAAVAALLVTILMISRRG